jgi:DNA polymerase III alpha subunit
MKKQLVIGLVAVAMTLTGAQAKDEMNGNAKHEKDTKIEQDANLKEVTLSGTIEKVEKRKKDGSVMMTWFVLVDESGKQIHLPKGKVEEFEGSKVRVTGMGVVHQKKGKEVVSIKSVTTIDKIEVAVAPAK